MLTSELIMTNAYLCAIEENNIVPSCSLPCHIEPKWRRQCVLSFMSAAAESSPKSFSTFLGKKMHSREKWYLLHMEDKRSCLILKFYGMCTIWQKDIYQSQGHKTSQAFLTGKMFQWNSGQLHIQLDQGVYNFNPEFVIAHRCIAYSSKTTNKWWMLFKPLTL